MLDDSKQRLLSLWDLLDDHLTGGVVGERGIGQREGQALAVEVELEVAPRGRAAGEEGVRGEAEEPQIGVVGREGDGLRVVGVGVRDQVAALGVAEDRRIVVARGVDDGEGAAVDVGDQVVDPVGLARREGDGEEGGGLAQPARAGPLKLDLREGSAGVGGADGIAQGEAITRRQG